MLHVLQFRRGHFREVGETLYHRAAGAPLQAAGERVRHQSGADFVCSPPRGLEARLPQSLAVHQQHARLAATQGVGNGVDGLPAHLVTFGRGQAAGGLSGLAPGHIGRQDQGGDLPRGAGRGLGRFGRVPGQLGRIARDPYEIGQRSGQPFDVGVERRVKALVVGRVVPDHVEHRRACAPRVVDVGQTVRQPGPQVK